MPKPPPDNPVMCSATACHCDHLEQARYIITCPDGTEEPVSGTCAYMHIAAGYRCRPLPEETMTNTPDNSHEAEQRAADVIFDGIGALVRQYNGTDPKRRAEAANRLKELADKLLNED